MLKHSFPILLLLLGCNRTESGPRRAWLLQLKVRRELYRIPPCPKSPRAHLHYRRRAAWRNLWRAGGRPGISGYWAAVDVVLERTAR